MKRTHLVHLVGALLLSSLGCVEEEPEFSVAPSGGARLVVALPRTVAASRVTSTVTHASGATEATSLTLDREGGRAWSAVVKPEAPEEEVGLRVDAVDASGEVVATASLDAKVKLPLYGEALVVVVPLPESGMAGLSNHAPLIHAVIGSKARVALGETVALQAQASDLDGDALTYAWSASSGTLECEEAACTWTALRPADAGDGSESRDGALVEVRVTDARGARSTLQFRVAVGTVRGDAALTDTRFNRSPVPAAIGQPQPVGLNTQVQVSATATDEDGPLDVLTYAWSATCEGRFDDRTLALPVFTPTAEPPACACQLRGEVTDGLGGSTEEVVHLCVRASAPPVVETAVQSAPSAMSGDRVLFTVTTTDPRSEALTYRWTSNVGAVGTAVTSGTGSTVDWTEVSCVPAGVTPKVELVVTNASGASTRQSFPVEWLGRRCGALETACVTTLSPGQVTLREDCVTQGTVFIPDGFTFNGAAHTLTASEDGAGDHYKGAVLRNRGTVANVLDLTVTARNLSDVCDADADRLRGILLEGASGTIEGAVVEDLHQAGNVGGCQEGFAIDVRNTAPGATPVNVIIRGNRLTGYQKAGVVVLGPVAVTVEDNLIDGLGPTNRIARIGIQLAYGVSGRVVGNAVKGNAYLLESDYSSGILVLGGSYYGAGRALCHDLLIQQNTLAENDVGVSLLQAEGDDFSPPAGSQNIAVLANELSKEALTNSYQAAVSDNGTANLISRNRISGDGYDPAVYPDNVLAVDVTTQGEERKVGFATPARTLDAGTCSEALVVQGWDLAGNLATLSVPAVTLAASDAGATFHLQPDCSDAPVTEVVLKNTQREGIFYLRASAAGVLTVTATGDGVSTTQDQTVR